MNLTTLIERTRIGIAVMCGSICNAGLVATVAADTVIDFEELSNWTSSGASGSYYNGSHTNATNSVGWTSGGGTPVYFGNEYTLESWGSYWNGFAYSNVNDTVTEGYTNQYAAITGTGVGGSGNYAVAYGGQASYFNLPSGWRATSLQVTNTTYATLAMRDSYYNAKKFGGDTGDDPDYLLLTLTGYDELGGTGNVTGSRDFYLADFRSANNALDYMVDQWTSLDLNPLGAAASIRLTFSGSDVGAFGLNTPAYVAMDNLTLTSVPEPTSGLGGLVLGYLLLRRQRRR